MWSSNKVMGIYMNHKAKTHTKQTQMIWMPIWIIHYANKMLSHFYVLISMCLVLECMTEFLVRLIALVLSHFKGMWSRDTPKSSSCCFIQRLWAQQLPTAIYLASTENVTCPTCTFYNSKTLEKFQVYDMSHLYFFLSNLHPTKSESEKAC